MTKGSLDKILQVETCLIVSTHRDQIITGRDTCMYQRIGHFYALCIQTTETLYYSDMNECSFDKHQGIDDGYLFFTCNFVFEKNNNWSNEISQLYVLICLKDQIWGINSSHLKKGGNFNFLATFHFKE